MQTFGKVGFYTLGCKLNFSESSTLARRFREEGYEVTEGWKDVDICVINSCSVTEHADKKCRNIVRRIHRENPRALIVVTGCYAQLKPAEIAAIEGVDLVLSNNDKSELFDKVVALDGVRKGAFTSCATENLTRYFPAYSSGDRTRSFLKVQDGCDYKCAYCTIHYARGASRNIPIAELVPLAEKIAEGGQREIVLTGVNIGDFGKTTGESFADLIGELDKVDGIDRYRISSIEPNLLTDEVIEFCSKSEKFQPHFHIPIQSGSDKILGLMRRRYTTARFADRIERLKALMPDVFIGIDVIVGFPGETDDDFNDTYEFLKRMEPAYLHIFPFSERAGTPAVTFPNKVKDSVKTERAAKLDALCKELHLGFYRRFVGTEADVLFEGRARNGYMYGYTGNYIKVRTKYNAALINEICRVKLLELDANNCEMLAEIAD